MTESAEALERRIDELRVAVRQAVMGGDPGRARALRADLRRAEQAWDEALASFADQVPESIRAAVVVPRQAGPLVPIREQVHHALTLLSVPSSPKLITAVHEALLAGEMIGARLTYLRRDEERSFRASPHSRPYYLCSALTADLLAPARGVLAISTWPMERRIMGPLSPRVNFLISTIRIAEHMQRVPDRALGGARLLWRFATNIPGAAESFEAMDPADVAQAARTELEIHDDADRSHREAAAARARTQLDDSEQLFGSRLRVVARNGTDT